MKKSLITLLVFFSLSGLTGCSSNKVRGPHFKKYGSAVSQEYFEIQIQNKIQEITDLFYRNNQVPRRNVSIDYETEAIINYRSAGNLSPLNIHTEVSGDMKIDVFNYRFELETSSKYFVKNASSYSTYLKTLGLEDGMNRKKQHLYGEKNGNQLVLIDMDYRTIDFETYNDSSVLSFLPQEITSDLFSYSFSGSNQSTTSAYINGKSIFTYIVRDSFKESNQNYYIEETVQFIFNNGLKMLYKTLLSRTNSSDQYSVEQAAEIRLKPYNKDVKKVNYDNYDITVIDTNE